jgi:hypothetical protein
MAAAAAADDVSAVQAKVSAALKSAKSFVATTTVAADGLAQTTVYIQPDRIRTDIAVGGSTLERIAIGGFEYSSRNGAPFERTAITPESAAALKKITAVTVTKVLPDVTVDGTTYGAYETTLPGGAGSDPTHLTCTYEKKSARLVRCENATITETFSGYDDPKNVVDAPAGAEAK